MSACTGYCSTGGTTSTTVVLVVLLVLLPGSRDAESCQGYQPYCVWIMMLSSLCRYRGNWWGCGTGLSWQQSQPIPQKMHVIWSWLFRKDSPQTLLVCAYEGHISSMGLSDSFQHVLWDNYDIHITNTTTHTAWWNITTHTSDHTSNCLLWDTSFHILWAGQ